MQGIFVVGTGRSGTHFTIRLLEGFSGAHDPLAGVENNAVLMDIAKAAIHHRMPSEATADYYRRQMLYLNGVFLDQHHPNLFFVEHWAAMFPGLVFLYPDRPAYQVVASMLRHGGVMSWYRHAGAWQDDAKPRVPFPNRFLGLDRFEDIEALPKHLLCAHRVFAHRRAFLDREEAMGGALRRVDYEALVADPEGAFRRVFTEDEQAALGDFELVEEPRAGSLKKYLDVLTKDQIDEIEALEGAAFGR
ncbi:sulfotransferase [Maritimibacter dapengensis]|uniref:Sulfotransferase n=1 Tax=Maritimibacter dapengensis TaxID=2836868 RepID=A0ABS6T1G9_9RHOB|nr:sulfotransferase [Maritimibacter dapengensis]MBV7379062.1 sulfotransferase [Maritimibacter dapengensis]